MRRYFSIILFLSFTYNCVIAQEEQVSGRRAAAAATESSSTTVTVRAQNMYGNTEINTDNVVWLREIYRELDLTEAKNGPLYFPVEPIDNRINLFTLIFNLLAESKINAYEYLDGREVFSDKYKLDFKEVLNKYGVYYEEKFSRSSKNPVYSIHESDIPSNEVLAFYIKEMWYFDQVSSTFDTKIIAMCPLLSRTGDFGDLLRIPMFWVTYDELRPYLSQVQIMTSNYNNVLNSTFNDYFRQRLYEGEIYKATNLANLAIMNYATTDSLQQLERKRIEDELAAFEKSLWERPEDNEATIQSLRSKKKLSRQERDLLRKLEADEKEQTTTAAVSDDAEKKEPETEVSSSSSSTKKNEKKQKTQKSSSKEPKQQKTPTRSVRRR